MAYTEDSYDLLDVLRVVRGAWVYIVLVPLIISGALAVWAYLYSRDVGLPDQSQTIVRFSADAFPMGSAEDELRSNPELMSTDRSKYQLSIEDVPGAFQPTYRTVRIRLSTTTDVDGRALLRAAISRLADTIDALDLERQRQIEELEDTRQLLSDYLALFSGTVPNTLDAEIVAEAATAASLVVALQNLDARKEHLVLARQGPIEVVEPVQSVSSASSLRWIRFPIVGAIGGLVAVLIAAFTLDGLQIAAARRQDR